MGQYWWSQAHDNLTATVWKLNLIFQKYKVVFKTWLQYAACQGTIYNRTDISDIHVHTQSIIFNKNANKKHRDNNDFDDNNDDDNRDKNKINYNNN